MHKFLFDYPVTCDICGEEGVGDLKTSAAAWDPHASVVHRDRRVCIENLNRQKKKVA